MLPAANRKVSLDLSLFNHHCLLLGKPGMGKTTLLLILLAEHLHDAYSVVLIDPKESTFGKLLTVSPLPPDQTLLFLPSRERQPGWNPLLEEAPATGIADTVTTLSALLAGGDLGVSLKKTMRNALLVLSIAGRSIMDLPAFLTDVRFRMPLLQIGQVAPRDLPGYREAVRYFTTDYLAKKGESVDAVLNKVDQLLTQPFFANCFHTRANTFSIHDPWKEQLLVGFNVDDTEEGLGPEAALFMGGLVTTRLIGASVRPRGTRKVVLSLDEIGNMEKLLGEQLQKVIAVSREGGLRLFFSTQYLSRLSPDLREAALGVDAIFCFQLTPPNAQVMARIFADASDQKPEYWERELKGLEKHTCVFYRPGFPPAFIKVAHFDPVPLPGWQHRGGRLLPPPAPEPEAAPWQPEPLATPVGRKEPAAPTPAAPRAKRQVKKALD